MRNGAGEMARPILPIPAIWYSTPQATPRWPTCNAAALAPGRLVPIHSFETARSEFFEDVDRKKDDEWWVV